MNRLRWKILGVTLTAVAVTVAITAMFTRRVTHEEMRKLLLQRTAEDVTPIAEHFRTHGNWTDVEQTLARMNKRVVLMTPAHDVIAVSPDLRGANITVTGSEVRIFGPGTRMTVLLAPDPIRIGGRVVAYAYVFPDRTPIAAADVSTLDSRLLATFASATVVAILLSILLSRRITRPVERLTAAAEAMTRGAQPLPVPVSGGDEIAQLARSFNAMVATLREQEELRRRMVTDVAHELRTPLTNLCCELEAIQDGLASADSPGLASLHEETLHLSRLVEDLQELSIADAGALSLAREPLDLGSAVARVAEVVRPEAARRQIALTVTREEAVVDADPTRIAQIVLNLLTNALQHTPDRGRIDVVVTHHATNAIVSIADSGTGIPAADLERIFERFYRVDPSRSRGTGGAGLGLAIVKRLVDQHGGSVRAENEDGGAKFTFAIPLHHTFTSRG